MTLDDDWMTEGACIRVPNADKIFFPDVPKGQNGRIEYGRAKEICKDCPVRTHCLSYAIAHKIPYGVWGGASPNERARIPKSRRLEIRRAWRRVYPTTVRMNM